MVKIDDIINVEFSRAFMGYDMKEVDIFLDAVIEQMEAFDQERKEMLTALEYLLHELEQIEQSPESAKKRVSDGASTAERSKAKKAAAELRNNLRRVPQQEAPVPPRTVERNSRTRHRAAAPAEPPVEPTARPDDEVEPDIPTYVFAGAEEAEEPVAEEYELFEAAPAEAQAADGALAEEHGRDEEA